MLVRLLFFSLLAGKQFGLELGHLGSRPTASIDDVKTVARHSGPSTTGSHLDSPAEPVHSSQISNQDSTEFADSAEQIDIVIHNGDRPPATEENQSSTDGHVSPNRETLGGEHFTEIASPSKKSISRLSSVDSEFECTICLQGIEKHITELYMLKECGHQFHKICIDQWMRQSNSCPICRKAQPAFPLPVIPNDVALDIGVPETGMQRQTSDVAIAWVSNFFKLAVVAIIILFMIFRRMHPHDLL